MPFPIVSLFVEIEIIRFWPKTIRRFNPISFALLTPHWKVLHSSKMTDTVKGFLLPLPPLPLVIRLNALQYSELTDKLQAPIRTARSVVILQSLSERFAAAFAQQVERNGVYHLPPGSPVRGGGCVCVCVCVGVCVCVCVCVCV